MHRARLALAVAALTSALIQPMPGKAVVTTTVCTAAWTTPNATPGANKSAILTGPPAPICPDGTITATMNVGSGANAGVVNTSDSWAGTGTNQFTPTSTTSLDIGINGTTTENLALSFSQPVTDPYVFIAYTDAGDTYTFDQAFQVLQSNNVSASGNTVTGTGGSNSANDGFVAKFPGTFSNLTFTYQNTTASVQSVTFTTGANYIPVPAPLPLLGAGVGFGLSRRLRRRLRAGQ